MITLSEELSDKIGNGARVYTGKRFEVTIDDVIAFKNLFTVDMVVYTDTSVLIIL